MTTILNKLNINTDVKWNLSPSEIEKICLLEGSVKKTNLEAITVDTGKFTGRAPKDRYIVNDSETKEEILRSKKILEDLTQNSVDFFAYPYGTKNSYKKMDYKILKDNNFKLAFTTEFYNYKIGSHSPFFIPRMGLGNYNNDKSIRDKVIGLDSLIKKIY